MAGLCPHCGRASGELWWSLRAKGINFPMRTHIDRCASAKGDMEEAVAFAKRHGIELSEQYIMLADAWGIEHG